MNQLKVGDKFTMAILIKRRWYQLWKPKWRKEVQTFTVKHVG